MLLKSFPCVARKIEMCYKKAESLTSVSREFQWCFNEFSRKLLFHESFVFKFCMELIAASRAEGGLVTGESDNRYDKNV